MIPLPELAVEFILGLGAALLLANLWVLVRPRVQKPRPGRPVPRPPSTRRVVLNILVGAIVAAWAAATLIANR